MGALARFVRRCTSLPVTVVGVLLLQHFRSAASRVEGFAKESTSPRSDAQIKQDRLNVLSQDGQNELDAAAKSVDTIARADTEHHCTVGIDLAKKVVVVWRKGGANGLDDPTRELYEERSPDFPVEFRDSLLSMAEQRAIQNSVVARFTDLRRLGIIITLIGPLYTGEPLVIQYSAKGNVPDLDLLIRLGITKNWPPAALDGAVEFRAGDTRPF